MSGYADFAQHYLAAGWAPLPLPHGKKKSPPEGWTGYGAPMPSYADVAEWADQQAGGNVALRMPPNVVGIDVDAYKPEALATMQALTASLGELPLTWRSTSREDGLSGIYFFHVPEGLRFGDVGPGVETLRHEHRYAIVAPSLHPEGRYYRWWGPDGSEKAPKAKDLPQLPAAWVQHLVDQGETRVKERTEAPQEAYTALADDDRARIDSYVTNTLAGIRADLTESATWAVGQADPRGRGWEKLQADKAIRMAALAMAGWNTYTLEQARADFVEWAPTGGGWSKRDVEGKWYSQERRAQPQEMPLAAPKVDIYAGAGGVPTPASPDGFTNTGAGSTITVGHEELDAGNPAKMVDWMRDNLGAGRLAGIFSRGSDIVFTPRLGQDGYIEPRLGEPEGTASISVLDAAGLAARVQNRYRVVKITQSIDPETKVATKSKTAHLFPMQAALYATRTPDDMRALKPLVGVVHTPTFRPDGSLITIPGYDQATGNLFLPTGGQPGSAVPEMPSIEEVQLAAKRVRYMLQDFSFVTESDLANYVGLMLTPLLRNMVPAPYKLGVIEAHQPGSGKTYLARALMTIHSGIMHSEMPSEEPELVKTITSVLDTSTGAVVVFDNVSGVVRSSALAGLLTSPTFQGRRLGTGKLVDVVNDRLWVITGNNAMLGGDLARRSLRIKLDPAVPNPELRTGFVIKDFERWVHRQRGDLLWSLLVMVRHWISIGSPIPSEQRADSYGEWDAVVGSILAASGFGGVFDDPASAEAGDPDADEWANFLERIFQVHGEVGWTTKQLMAQVAPLGFDTAVLAHPMPISYELLPSSLVDSARSSVPAPPSLSVRLGKFLANREGRWFGGYTVRRGGTSKRSMVWHVRKDPSTPG